MRRMNPDTLRSGQPRHRHAGAVAALLAAALLTGHPGPAAAQGAQASASPSADEPARPRVGLVLGGGGARGAAHIGVLEVLERLRVPVDCVAGTSMGALVAGALGAGLDTAQMRQAMAAADWRDMFNDEPSYAEQDFRRRRLAQRYLPGSELGVGPAGLSAPGGVVSGQKIKLFLNQLVGADRGERELGTLALPVSIIATDIGTGARVVLREGSLTQAMRASMSVPGLMAPVELDGRKLVDGGLVDNLPIREVRERCAAERVIVVNVGSPLLPASEVGGLLSVSAQMVNILTEQNVSLSLATLRTGDIYLKPALDGLGSADFERHADAAARGRAAAEAVTGQLQTLSLSEADYAAWRARLAGTQTTATTRIDAVEVASTARIAPQTVKRHLRQQAGEPLDTARLNRDLLRIYGDGLYQSVDYQLLTQLERTVLRVLPVEKSWGPDYFRLGLNLDANLLQGSTYSLRAALQRTLLNPQGGEMLLSAELGRNQGLAAEWVQPIGLTQRWFVQGSAELRRERADLFQGGKRIAEFRIGRGTLEATAGLNLGLLGQARLGWRESRRSTSIETGPQILPSESTSFGGLLLALDLDQLNQPYFPTRGWALSASWYESRERDYARAAIELRAAASRGDWVIGSRLAYTGPARGRLPAYDAASLGGFLNLSGFASGQLLADTVSYAHLRGERIVGRLPLGLRGDLRLGLALEAGRAQGLYSETSRSGWLDSTTVYLGGESPLGPVYVGLGHSTHGRGSTNAYLFVGTP